MSNFKHWNLAAKGMAFDPQTGESFQLNDSARLILSLVREGRSPEEVSRELARSFGIPYERAITDVLEFLVQLDLMGTAA